MHIKLPKPVRNFLVATSFWKEYYFILREFKHFRQIAILAAVFTLLAAVLEGFGVGFILAVLHSVLNPNAKPIQTGVGWFDVWILAVNASTAERLYRSSALVLLTTILRLGLTYLGRLYVFTAQYTLGYRLSLQVFEQLQALSLSFFTKTRAGNLVNSLTSEVNQITAAFDVLATFFTRGSTLIAYMVSMFLLSWQLTAITAMLFSLLSVGITTLLGQIREASFATTKARRWYVSVALEFINGIRTVQAFAAQDFERKRFYNASQQLLQASTKSRAAQALVEPVSEGIATFILFGILFLAFAVLIPNGQLQPAGLLTFLFVLLRLMPVRRQLDAARAKLSSFQGSFSNVKELLRTDNKIYLRNGKLQFSKLQRAIEFVCVDFSYDRANPPVLHNIKLTINRGEMTALVGASGAGKTTLADLIPRFYDPTQGQIFIDGIDLKEYDIKSLRRKLAVVSQDTFIFNASVRDNIAYALEEVDEAAVWEAARLANALEFIQKLPEGFDTQLGERGIRLSGGQRQRLAIARALLRDPDILILDEATSALDSVSERLIQESLENLSQGRTVIAIAHRLSTIVRADKVVVLEQGRILEQGTYQELLQQRGNLWKYHQMQHEVGQLG